ncbi:MAG: hypothetical protein AB7P12_19070, partial [Alphaproteobacteria bacterium]
LQDAEGARPAMSAPSLSALAGAALSLVRPAVPRADPRLAAVRDAVCERDGFSFRITLGGPDVPDGIPAAIATPAEVAANRPWTGRYRLTARVPLVVLDLYWNPGEPLRIMSFSRGAWEDALIALAR